MKVSFTTRTYIATIASIILVILLSYSNDHEDQIFLRLLLGSVIAYTLLFYLFRTGKLDAQSQHTFSRLLLYGASIFTLVMGISHFSQFKNEHHDDSFFVVNGNAWISDFFGIILAFLIFYIAFSALYLLWEKMQKTRNEKVKSELTALKNQINPHFYFNTLNNLYSLIKTDPEEAQKFVLKLSDLMRYTIYEGGKKYVSLENESKYLQNFIDLQSSRFEKDIAVSFIKNITQPQTKISPLLFIVLLENAFKHGVEKLIENAKVDVDLTEIDGEVTFRVSNNFEPSDQSSKKGIGLQNLKESLILIYPHQHILTFESTKNHYNVELKINTK